jgi:hypothetical protein
MLAFCRLLPGPCSSDRENKDRRFRGFLRQASVEEGGLALLAALETKFCLAHIEGETATTTKLTPLRCYSPKKVV